MADLLTTAALDDRGFHMGLKRMERGSKKTGDAISKSLNRSVKLTARISGIGMGMAGGGMAGFAMDILKTTAGLTGFSDQIDEAFRKMIAFRREGAKSVAGGDATGLPKLRASAGIQRLFGFTNIDEHTARLRAEIAEAQGSDKAALEFRGQERKERLLDEAAAGGLAADQIQDLMLLEDQLLNAQRERLAKELAEQQEGPTGKDRALGVAGPGSPVHLLGRALGIAPQVMEAKTTNRHLSQAVRHLQKIADRDPAATLA